MHKEKALDGKKLSILVHQILDSHKAEDIRTIDLKGKSDMADYIVIASGLNTRHLHALADHLRTDLKKERHTYIHVEGDQNTDWVLVDLNTVIVHLFKPDIRSEYDLESMWDTATFKKALKNRSPQASSL